MTTLGKVIEVLSSVDPAKQVSPGFGFADSYRGYYEQVAFEPVPSATVGSMLREAQRAVGRTYEGYKGGKFTMDEDTTCVVASYGVSNGTYDADALVDVLLAAVRGE